MASAATSSTTPSDFLSNVIGKAVQVRLNSGVEYHGVLVGLDGFMNIAMEQTEEFVEGKLKNRYGDAFIRGNNGTYYHIYHLSFLHTLPTQVMYINAAKTSNN